MNKKIKLIHNRIEELKGKLISSFLELADAHGERFLTCSSCGTKSKVKTCVGLDCRYWDSNTGSPCGGFYSHENYAWECPKCENFKDNEIDGDIWCEMYSSFKNRRTEDIRE